MAKNLKLRVSGWIERLLAAAGVACLALYGLSHLDAWWLDRRVEIVHAAGTAEAPATLEPGAVVGRLRIPQLDMDAVVLEGTEAAVLRRAVGRVSTTRQPWEPGTVALAAHRDTFFRGLRDIEAGDLVQLVTERGTWTYRVTGFEVVDPEAVHVLADSERPRLVLVTCHPFNYIGSAPRRFVVFADRVEPGSPSSSL